MLRVFNEVFGFPITLFWTHYYINWFAYWFAEDYSCLPAESSTSHFTGRCSAGDGPGGTPGAIKGRRDGSPDRAQTTPTQTDIDKDVYDKLRPYDEELNEISGILQRICAAHDVDTFQCPALPARPDTKRPDHTEHSKPELGHHKVNVLPTTTEPPPLETTKSNGSANVSKEELDRIAFGLAYVAGINTFVWVGKTKKEYDSFSFR